MKTLMVKVGPIADPIIDDQVSTIIAGHVRFLGYRDADPDTAGWGKADVCEWYLWDSGAWIKKFWDGAAVRTVTAT